MYMPISGPEGSRMLRLLDLHPTGKCRW